MVFAMFVGGLISLSIIITAAASPMNRVENAADLAIGLEPIFGSFAKHFLGIGLFAAGLTSAITAPLAAAYVASECFGWNTKLKSSQFRTVWISVLTLGVLVSSMGIKLITIIQFAQITNGIILPLIAGILLWIMNKASVFGKYKNSITQNLLGLLIVFFTLFIGLKSILSVFNLF
jgi:Mn2+/Fe2+ NRAMP family transporter